MHPSTLCKPAGTLMEHFPGWPWALVGGSGSESAQQLHEPQAQPLRQSPHYPSQLVKVQATSYGWDSADWCVLVCATSLCPAVLCADAQNSLTGSPSVANTYACGCVQLPFCRPPADLGGPGLQVITWAHLAVLRVELYAGRARRLDQVSQVARAVAREEDQRVQAVEVAAPLLRLVRGRRSLWETHGSELAESLTVELLQGHRLTAYLTKPIAA